MKTAQLTGPGCVAGSEEVSHADRYKSAIRKNKIKTHLKASNPPRKVLRGRGQHHGASRHIKAG